MKDLSGLHVSISFSPLSMQSDKSSERVQAESQTGKIHPENPPCPIHYNCSVFALYYTIIPVDVFLLNGSKECGLLFLSNSGPLC